jgi:hypothetical protein
LILVLAGCASTSQEVRTPRAARAESTELCPLVRRGAVVTAEDLPGAAALLVTMRSTNPVSPDLDTEWARRQARQLAERHESARVQGGTDAAVQILPPHTVSVEYVLDGARLVYRPLAPDALGSLRLGVHEIADEMPIDCSSRLITSRDR